MTIMADQSAEEREYRPFTQIKGNYPKQLLTRSDPIQQHDGIIHASTPEFMQETASRWANRIFWPFRPCASWR